MVRDPGSFCIDSNSCMKLAVWRAVRRYGDDSEKEAKETLAKHARTQADVM